MINYLLVGIGGAFGSVFRYSIGRKISEKTKTTFPLGTFIINITGSFLLGIVTTLDIKPTAYNLLADGFLGAYTTFSTFMYEGFNLFQDRQKLNAGVYIVSSLVIGMLGFLLGVKTIGFFNG